MTDLDQIALAASVLLYAAGAATALRAAETAETAQGAVAWAIGLVTLPWLAIPAYLLFGPPRLGPLAEGLAEARALAAARRPDSAAAPRGAPASEALRGPLERLVPHPAVAAPPPALLEDAAIFEAAFAAIDAAERYVFVQFYIFRDDRIGRAFAERLMARAGDGVRVLLLYDEVGARNAPDLYWRRLEEAGVAVRAFTLNRRWPKVMRLNFRNHRKMVVADGRVAILCGANVADEYLGRDPAFGPWRDTGLRVEGAAAARLEASFVEDWLWTGGEAPPDPAPPAPAPAETAAQVLALPTGPADPSPACSLAFMHLATAARRRLWIASPYFAPDLDMLTALKLAALRGVDVRILTPHRPDHRIVWLAAFAFAEETFRAGVGLYRYEAGFMHQKALVIDDLAAAVGTVNLDNRSFRLNFELTALVFDAGFAAEVAAMLERDFARSRPHDAAFHAGRGLAVRLLAPAARLFSPLL